MEINQRCLIISCTLREISGQSGSFNDLNWSYQTVQDTQSALFFRKLTYFLNEPTELYKNREKHFDALPGFLRKTGFCSFFLCFLCISAGTRLWPYLPKYATDHENSKWCELRAAATSIIRQKMWGSFSDPCPWVCILMFQFAWQRVLTQTRFQ